MEENKETVKENKDMVSKNPAKFTYEQLEQIAGNLSNQVQQLSTRLQEANMFNMFKRLDYLFKVLEFANMFSPTFTDQCLKEVESLMTPPAPVEKEPTEKEGEE